MDRRLTTPGRAATWAVLAALVTLGAAHDARAIDWKGRFWIGGRLADYLPADEQGGGFRFNAQAFGSRTENEVKAGEVPAPSLSFGYGVKQWKAGKSGRPCDMTLEIEATWISTSFGDETGYIDENASTRFRPPGDSRATGPDGDESFETFPLGDLTIVPVLVTAAFHWGAPKADFYVGIGGGYAFADISEASEYATFVGDLDGTPDVSVDGGAAVSIKAGSNVRLTKGGKLYLYFEAEFFTMDLFGGGPKVAWPGVDGFFGTRDYDIDGDGLIDEVNVLSDFHVVDPGKVRLDGLMAGIGLRYRFGGDKASAAPAAAATPSGT